MLDVLGQSYPGVFAFFINREYRWRKAELCEGTDRDGDVFLSILACPVNRCTAVRTEVESSPVARIAYAYVLL